LTNPDVPKAKLETNRARVPVVRERGEEATIQALVLPMLYALGYDMRNPIEVVPEHDTDFASQTGGMPFSNAVRRSSEGKVTKLAARIPPTNECAEIAEKIAINTIYQASERLTDPHKQLGVQDQSVLTSARRGERVPQDPNYKPAEARLALIQAMLEYSGPGANSSRYRQLEGPATERPGSAGMQ
jgi:hypothetical protein